MKPNKNEGCHGIAVVMIKHDPETISKGIANTFNNTVKAAGVPGQLGTVYWDHSKNFERSKDHHQTYYQ